MVIPLVSRPKGVLPARLHTNTRQPRHDSDNRMRARSGHCYLRSLPEDLNRGMDLLAEIVRYPVFPEGKVNAWAGPPGRSIWESTLQIQTMRFEWSRVRSTGSTGPPSIRRNLCP